MIDNLFFSDIFPFILFFSGCIYLVDIVFFVGCILINMLDQQVCFSYEIDEILADEQSHDVMVLSFFLGEFDVLECFKFWEYGYGVVFIAVG